MKRFVSGDLPLGELPEKEVSALPGVLARHGFGSDGVPKKAREAPENGPLVADRRELRPLPERRQATVKPEVRAPVEPKSFDVRQADPSEFRMTPVGLERVPPSDPQHRAIFDARCRMSEMGPFDALGVQPGAPLSEIRDARFRLLAKYDPEKYVDTFMGPENHADLEAIRAHVDFVTRCLVDPIKRGMAERLAGGRDRVQLSGYFAADHLFRRGMVLLRKKSFTKAVQVIEQAISENPRDPEYYTRLAQAKIEFHRSSKSFGEVVQHEVVGLLEKALELSARNEPALVLLGRVLIAKRELPKALGIYQQVLLTNPRSPEARKAVRELTAKLGVAVEQQQSNAKQGGFLGRFRKDK